MADLPFMFITVCFPAGEIGYSFDKIKIFELEYQRPSGSPTKALLWDLGSRNTTLRELYLKLQKVDRVREMKIIEKYCKCTGKSKYLRNLCK